MIKKPTLPPVSDGRVLCVAVNQLPFFGRGCFFPSGVWI